MPDPYQEILEGETLVRRAPGPRHELICGRLHAIVHSSVANLTSTKLLPPRAPVQLSPFSRLCPDLGLVALPNGRLWLAAEIVNSEDHRADTVIKKDLYEQFKLPRLWMIDPRYDNVEIYHGGQYGLVLKTILAGQELLTEQLLPEFQLNVAELFSTLKA
ncbi:MAG TPA: Uma2 family endonuclease [Candidatus Dormibacteraeota bacterium]|nr:Uma2 family endonuclease [Candidatus Dormibacteraeota bacterium]